MKLIKRLKDKCLSISTAQLIGLIAMLSLASCQKNCKPSNEEASLTLEIDKDTLTGNDKTINVTIKNKAEGVASSDNFSLKASITETGSSLQYTNAVGEAENEAKIDQPLTHFTKYETLDPDDSVNITFAFQPGQGVCKAEVTLELYDTDKGAIVATKTATWSPLYSMSLTGIADSVQLKGSEAIEFRVRNDGDEVSTDSIEVHLASTNNISFTLNNKQRNGIIHSLKEILGGSASTLAKGDSTKAITLKNVGTWFSSSNDSQITLKLKKGDTILDTKELLWKK